MTKNAGQLWTGLLDFDQTIRDIYMVQIKDNPQRLKRFKKWAKENPPSFKRKYVQDKVSVPEMDFSECSGLNMAVVIPHIIERGKKSVIISNAMKPGNVEIALYSSDGAKKIKTLYKSPVDGSTDHNSGSFLITWDGKDPDKKETYKGDYRIRWTFGDGYREYPVIIK